MRENGLKSLQAFWEHSRYQFEAPRLIAKAYAKAGM